MGASWPWDWTVSLPNAPTDTLDDSILYNVTNCALIRTKQIQLHMYACAQHLSFTGLSAISGVVSAFSMKLYQQQHHLPPPLLPSAAWPYLARHLVHGLQCRETCHCTSRSKELGRFTLYTIIYMKPCHGNLHIPDLISTP